jgi:hypothetical protein
VQLSEEGKAKKIDASGDQQSGILGARLFKESLIKVEPINPGCRKSGWSQPL